MNDLSSGSATSGSATKLKRDAGEAACQYLRENMKLGIGTGSTAEQFIYALAEKVQGGLNIIGVPTSVQSENLCKKLSIPLSTLDETPKLDLVIDGADELDSNLNLIKGGGGALLREKIVASAAKEMLVIADESKLVKVLGKFPLAVEIESFGYLATIQQIKKICVGKNIQLRMEKSLPFLSDGKNYIVDIELGKIENPSCLEQSLNSIAGVVENGLFTTLATRAIIATKDGIKTIKKNIEKNIEKK